MSVRTRRLMIGLFVVLAFIAVSYVGLNLAVLGVGKKLLRGASDSGYLAAVVSLAALNQLERGEVEDAKRLLADIIANYCKSDAPDADPSRKAQLRDHAERLSVRSSVLKVRLSKPAP